MPKIMPFHAKENMSDDMKEYTLKLKKHRLGVAGRWAACILAVLLIFFGVSAYFNNKTYEGYSVLSTTKHSYSINTRYAEYGDCLLRYSKDGVSCESVKGEGLWSQTFNMQDPMLVVCGKAAAAADIGGNQLYIFDETGLKGQVDTLLPIQKVSVSRLGTAAVILEDSNVSWLYLYDQEGNKLLEARCNLSETGQPLSLSLAPDGTKLAVAYLQVSGGAAGTCVVFYNLGSVGDNFVDKIVASKKYDDLIIPRVQYLDSDTCAAISEKGCLIFEGAEIPEEAAEGKVEGEIQSVFFGEGKIGLVCRKEGETSYTLRVFDDKGRQTLEQTFELPYTQIRFSGSNIIVYNETDCVIYSTNGVLRYSGNFKESVSYIYSLSSRRFLVIHPQSTEKIKLK